MKEKKNYMETGETKTNYTDFATKGNQEHEEKIFVSCCSFT